MNKSAPAKRRLIIMMSYISLFYFPFSIFAEKSLEVYSNSVKPLLEKHCYKCHGPDKQKGDFRLDKLDPDMINGPNADFWHEALNQINGMGESSK